MKYTKLDEYETVYLAERGEFFMEKILTDIRRQELLSFIKRHAFSSFLEIGCGPDPIVSYLDSYSLFVAVEPSLVFLKRAKENSMNKDVIFYNEYVENVIPLIKGHVFDLIILNSVLHELEDPMAVLKQLLNVCSPSTVVYINVPNAHSMHRILGTGLGIIKSPSDKSDSDVKYRHSVVFTMDMLKEVVDSCGYFCEDYGTFFIKPFSNSQIEEMLKACIINMSTLTGLHGLSSLFPDNGAEMFVSLRKK